MVLVCLLIIYEATLKSITEFYLKPSTPLIINHLLHPKLCWSACLQINNYFLFTIVYETDISANVHESKEHSNSVYEHVRAASGRARAEPRELAAEMLLMLPLEADMD